jgi:O-antigen/teichoic acid export membrane protein
MAPLIPVMYFDHVTDGMLKGLGEQLYTMRVNIADSIFSCVLVWLILPHSGIVGYVFIIFAAEILNTAFSVGRLASVAGIKVNLLKRLALPILCIAVSCTATHVFSTLAHAFEGTEAFDIAAKIIISSIGYFVLLRLCNGLTKQDLNWIRSIFSSKSKKGL